MRVEILEEVCDHVRSYQPGAVWDLPDDQAERWIKAGHAKPAPSVPEAAALADAPEKAVLPRASKR